MTCSRARALAVSLVATALLPGCSLGSFDYLSAEFQDQGMTGSAGAGGAPSAAGAAGASGAAGTTGDAGGGAAGAPAMINPCEGQTEGTPCDDGDVCTRTSLCVAGGCQGTGDHPCVVADTVAEYSMTQGLEGFRYGAWSMGSDADGTYQPETDFFELVVCPMQTWRPACVIEGDPAFRWTLIVAELQHAATIPVVELPVRRWVSDVSGPAVASLDHHHADPGDGDGTRAQLLMDGMLIWESQIDSSGIQSRQEDVPLNLEMGMRVELLLHPRANQARDMTHYSMVLRGK